MTHEKELQDERGGGRHAAVIQRTDEGIYIGGTATDARVRAAVAARTRSQAQTNFMAWPFRS
jgi:hypothetical protein